MKKYKIRAETSLRIYDNYFFIAENEDDAIEQFLEKKQCFKSFFSKIKATEVKEAKKIFYSKRKKI